MKSIVEINDEFKFWIIKKYLKTHTLCMLNFVNELKNIAKFQLSLIIK